MADAYIYNDAGKLKGRELTVTSTGASEAGKGVALDSGGKLDNSLLPSGIGAETKILPASEALSAGDKINYFDDSGTLKARKADASGPGEGKRAHGFVLAAVSSGADATTYVAGINNQLSGLTPGATYFLDTTAGGITTTVPDSTGNIAQEVGVALSATELAFQPGKPVQVP